MPARGRILSSVWLGLLILLMGTPRASPAVQDLRPSDLYQETVPGNASAHRPDALGEAFRNLLGEREIPIPCASSLLLDLRRHPENLSVQSREALRLLTVRPTLSGDEALQTRDGRYTIHYTTDPSSPDSIGAADHDLNGVPDRIDQVSVALEQAAAVLSGKLGWPAPSAGARADRYDVYLVNLGPAKGGYAVQDRDPVSGPREDSPSHIVLDSHLEDPLLQAAVAHQFAHASLLALSARSPVWWTEATATWLETKVTDDPTSYQTAASRRLERLDLSLTADSLLLAMGDALWVSFLADRSENGPDRVHQIWTDLSLRNSEATETVLGDALAREDREGIAGLYRQFTRWALFTGPRDDGAHFRQGGLFPPLSPRATHEIFPADSAGNESVEPLGAAIYRFVGNRSRGGLRIHLESDAGAKLEMDLVMTPAGESRRSYLVELRPDGEGRAEVGIPWHDVAEAHLIVRNGATGGGAIQFRYRAQMDPLFPYDLSSFTANPSPAGITLQWSTDREIDLLGWNVFRGSSPGGPFL
ncbi:MAG TPA: hypothetical protein VKL61_09285, partial [Candidatus Polarisedimenticolia bacterium]|nr:hypothetical protein [Candidatus Polarisedimenticolia bacterium]